MIGLFIEFYDDKKVKRVGEIKDKYLEDGNTFYLVEVDNGELFHIKPTALVKIHDSPRTIEMKEATPTVDVDSGCTIIYVNGIEKRLKIKCPSFALLVSMAYPNSNWNGGYHITWESNGEKGSILKNQNLRIKKKMKINIVKIGEG